MNSSSKKNSAVAKIFNSNGYTLKLADDVTKPTTKKATLSLSGNTATYKSSYETAGYSLASNAKSISYTKATTATTLATIQGAKSTKGLSVSDGSDLFVYNTFNGNNIITEYNAEDIIQFTSGTAKVAASGNDLSALVESKAMDYSLAEVETSLTSANALKTLTYSNKK